MQKGLEVKPVAISKGDKFSISRNRPRGTTGPYLSCWIFLSSRIYSPGALNGSADWQKASLFLAWSQLLRVFWEGCGGFWDFCCWSWDFLFIHLRTGLWLPLSGNYSSFLTVQEGPLKMLTSSKQPLPARGREATSHPGARKRAPLNLGGGLFSQLIFSSRSADWHRSCPLGLGWGPFSHHQPSSSQESSQESDVTANIKAVRHALFMSFFVFRFPSFQKLPHICLLFAIFMPCRAMDQTRD